MQTIFVVLLLFLPCTVYAKINAIASFSILADMVKEVGGEFVDVKSIVGPNADAHIFEPTPKVAIDLQAADITFINGLGLEPWFERLAKSSGYKKRVITATEGILPRYAKNNLTPDPHAWHNPELGIIYINNIAQALTSCDPEHAEYYQHRAENYNGMLIKLHKSILKSFKSFNLPIEIITNHDAFGYMEKAYGVTFISPLGTSTDSEASARDLAQLVSHIKSSGIKAIFLENIANSKLIEQIARESHIVVGGTLYSDALSKPEGPASNYLEMLKYNATTILKALGKY